MDREYRYWAWLSEGESSADRAKEIIRTWTNPEGRDREESYTPEGWKTTWTYQDVLDQHKRGKLLPLTVEDVERLTRRSSPGDEVPMDREYRYWAWLDEDDSSPDRAKEIIRTWESPEGFPMSESHTPDGWKRTGTYWDVRGRHERGYLLWITTEDADRLTRG